VKIILINPSNPYNLYRVPTAIRRMPVLGHFFNKEASSVFPPLNLAVLAAYVPPDVEVRIIDECVEPIDFEAEADLVGITAMTGMAPIAYKIADIFRARGIPVVLGGIHPTILPEEAAAHADAVVVGEGELVWRDLIEDFRRKRLQRLYRADGWLDMRGLPRPRRDLLNPLGYFIPNTVQTSRGCPFDCDFCSVSRTLGRTLRDRPVGEVVEEIRELPGRTLFFIDDMINAKPERARELYRAMIPLRMDWGGQATVTMANDDELLDLAAESGCKLLFIGFETLAGKSLKKLGDPKLWRERLLKTVEKIRRRRIAIWGSFVLGFDGDDEKTIREMVQLAIDAQIDFAQFSMLTPLPGTALYEEFSREGRIFNKDWMVYTMGEMVFEPAKMSSVEVKERLIDAWRDFYSLPSIFRRIRWGRGWKRHAVLWLMNVGIHTAVAKARSGSLTRIEHQPEAQFERENAGTAAR